MENVSLLDQKKAFVKAVVEDLKTSQGLLQRHIAERMGETEQALSRRMGKGGALPDDYLDKFAKEFNRPFRFVAADQVGEQGVSKATFAGLELEIRNMLAVQHQLVTTIRDLAQEVALLRNGRK